MTYITERRGGPPLILLGNDQEWAARSFESLLGPLGFATIRAFTGRQLLERARDTRPDAVVVDLSLPDLAGVEVVRRLREECALSPATPVVLVTSGSPSRRQRHEALEAGAWDLLGEPIDVDALALQLTAFIRAKRESDRVLEEGLLDADTGFYNARGLERRSREMAADAARRRDPVTCLALQALPVGWSRDAGDWEALQALARACRAHLRASDVVGRLGRTELVTLLPGITARQAAPILERIAASLRPVGEEGAGYELLTGMAGVDDYTSSVRDLGTLMVAAASELRRHRPVETLSGGPRR